MKNNDSTGLISRLRNRGVFRVAASYGVIAWLLLQIADVVLEPLGAPGWTLRAPSMLREGDAKAALERYSEGEFRSRLQACDGGPHRGGALCRTAGKAERVSGILPG
jgi:hypothetical protein